jgi:hypothetical protein
MAEMKAAWRGGTWWQDPGWRARFMATAGGLLVGGFASLSVLSPPGVKVFVTGTVVYVLARTAWEFWKA